MFRVEYQLSYRTNLSNGAPNAIHKILKVHQTKERLLFESVKLCCKHVLLVLQYRPWATTWGQRYETKPSQHTWTTLFHSPARDGLWLWFSNICTDSPTKRIFSATRTGMYEGSISTRKENCCRDGASMFSSSISLYRGTVMNRRQLKPRKCINYDNSQPVTAVNCQISMNVQADRVWLFSILWYVTTPFCFLHWRPFKGSCVFIYFFMYVFILCIYFAFRKSMLMNL